MPNPTLTYAREALAVVCQRYSVKSLSLFGSAVRDDFRSDSDVDVMVEFDPQSSPSLFSLVAMKEDLEGIFGHPVDLATPEILRNPYRRQTIERDLKRIYVS